jgi:hypothetical protein
MSALLAGLLRAAKIFSAILLGPLRGRLFDTFWETYAAISSQLCQ